MTLKHDKGQPVVALWWGGVYESTEILKSARDEMIRHWLN